MIQGTVLKITSVTSITPDSITISIYDPTNILVVTDQVMTDEGSNTYSYIYQNLIINGAGEYTTIISAVSGIYTARSKKTFILQQQL